MELLKCQTLILPVDTDKVPPRDCLNKIFKNKDGVLSILTNLEDIIKSNSYFGAHPYNMYLLSNRLIKVYDFYYDKSLNRISRLDVDAAKEFAKEIKSLQQKGIYFKVEATTDEKINLGFAYNSEERFLIKKSFLQKYVEKKGEVHYVNIETLDQDRPAKTRKDGSVIISKIKDTYTAEEAYEIARQASLHTFQYPDDLATGIVFDKDKFKTLFDELSKDFQ